MPATVAMLALLRIYAAPREEETLRLALLFWAALGLGILVNALLVPILVIVTLIALRFMDRDFWWMQRLAIASGVPIAVLIARPVDHRARACKTACRLRGSGSKSCWQPLAARKI